MPLSTSATIRPNGRSDAGSMVSLIAHTSVPYGLKHIAAGAREAEVIEDLRGRVRKLLPWLPEPQHTLLKTWRISQVRTPLSLADGGACWRLMPPAATSRGRRRHLHATSRSSRGRVLSARVAIRRVRAVRRACGRRCLAGIGGVLILCDHASVEPSLLPYRHRCVGAAWLWSFQMWSFVYFPFPLPGSVGCFKKSNR